MMLAVLLALSAEPRTVDVDEGVKLAMQWSPGLKSVNLRREAGVAQADALRGRMLPLIALSEEWQAYDKPFSVVFALPGAPPGTPAPSFVARGQFTNTFAAGVNQPLTGLFRIYEERASVVSNADATTAAARAAEASIREAVESGFLHYYEAKASEDIARTSQQQLEEQAALVLARVKAGTGTNADKLRLDVAISNAKLQRIQAAAAASSVRTALLLAMGLEGSSVELVQPTALEARPLPPISEADARAQAAKERPEVAKAVLDQRSAKQHANASYLALLPEVGLEGAYTNLHGQAFAPVDQVYFGVKATWPIWEWGATYYAARAADLNAQAAQEAVEDQQLQVKNDASARWVQATAAASAIEAAQTTIASAEEAYRVEQALVSAGSATTTDLLDAQSALTQAKLNLVRARYTQALALVALQRALGE